MNNTELLKIWNTLSRNMRDHIKKCGRERAADLLETLNSGHQETLTERPLSLPNGPAVAHIIYHIALRELSDLIGLQLAGENIYE